MVGKSRLSLVEVIKVTVLAVPVKLEILSIMTALVVTVTSDTSLNGPEQRINSCNKHLPINHL